MQFNQHTNLEGLHAPFSASKSTWLRYDDDDVIDSYVSRNRAALGTELHEYAKTQIDLSQKVTSIKSLINDISTFIHTKHHYLKTPNYGSILIRDLHYLPKEVFESLKLYINDGIGFKMDTEVILYYSDKFFGTADTISYRNRVLRIHDFKSGSRPVKNMDQLEVYAALFCLEYKLKPNVDIDEIVLQLYQNGEVIVHSPTAEDIVPIMDKIIHLNKILTKIDEEG